MNTFQTMVSRSGRRQLPDVDGLSRKIKLLKILIYSKFRVGGRPQGGHPRAAERPAWGGPPTGIEPWGKPGGTIFSVPIFQDHSAMV